MVQRSKPISKHQNITKPFWWSCGCCCYFGLDGSERTASTESDIQENHLLIHSPQICDGEMVLSRTRLHIHHMADRCMWWNYDSISESVILSSSLYLPLDKVRFKAGALMPLCFPHISLKCTESCILNLPLSAFSVFILTFIFLWSLYLLKHSFRVGKTEAWDRIWSNRGAKINICVLVSECHGLMIHQETVEWEKGVWTDCWLFTNSIQNVIWHQCLLNLSLLLIAGDMNSDGGFPEGRQTGTLEMPKHRTRLKCQSWQSVSLFLNLRICLLKVCHSHMFLEALYTLLSIL